MADKTKIEWTDATWNPITGCTRVDEGCRNCYAEIMAARFSDPGQWGHGLAQRVKVGGVTDHRWTGQTQLVEHKLAAPLHWIRPRRIFVCSTSDLFHERNPDAWIDRVFAVMALAPQHTFQVLTKRPERAREYLKPFCQRRANALGDAVLALGYKGPLEGLPWPLPNVWLGTSVSDQANADLRIPHLLATPAAVWFLSVEPMLGEVIVPPEFLRLGDKGWLICGGESGPGARPIHPDWARSLRDQCEAADVAFFFKQWGEWGPGSVMMATGEQVFRAFPNYQTWVNKAPTWVNGGRCFDAMGRECKIGGDFMRARDEGTFPVTVIHRVGKKVAGRTLDGRTWNQMPGVVG